MILERQSLKDQRDESGFFNTTDQMKNILQNHHHVTAVYFVRKYKFLHKGY